MGALLEMTGPAPPAEMEALKVGAHPRFETVRAVLRALGVKLSVSARGDVSISAALGGAGPVISKSAPNSAAPRISKTLIVGPSETVIVSRKKPGRGHGGKTKWKRARKRAPKG